MSEDRTPEGIAILLNEEGIINELIRDSISIFEKKDPAGIPFTEFLEGDSIQKGFEFINTVKKDGAAFNWEIHATVDGKECLLIFSGIEIGTGIIVLGTSSSAETEHFLNGLMEMNNEQVNKLRAYMKSNAPTLDKDKKEEMRRDNEWEMFDDMTSLNNELANTQRKLVKKTAELERTNEFKDQMLGMAAHDLRNPLTVIQNFAEFLMEDLEQGEAGQKQYNLAKEIKKSSDYMVQIVEDLLDISAIESGRVSLNKTEVDLNKLIKETVSLNKPSAEKKNIRLDLDLPDGSFFKEVDQHKFQQVLNNLISNAIKYSEFDTTTTVGLLDDNGSKEGVRIYVADEGQGIPKDELDNLFKPFAKVSVEATAGEKSTGLGLAITKKIVEAHGGSIEVETEVGEGTTFYVNLQD